jgi:hypothetical protein
VGKNLASVCTLLAEAGDDHERLLFIRNEVARLHYRARVVEEGARHRLRVQFPPRKDKRPEPVAPRQAAQPQPNIEPGDVVDWRTSKPPYHQTTGEVEYIQDGWYHLRLLQTEPYMKARRGIRKNARIYCSSVRRETDSWLYGRARAAGRPTAPGAADAARSSIASRART